MVVDFPFIIVVWSLTSWYAFLPLFFLRHASTSWHWAYNAGLFRHSHVFPDLFVDLCSIIVNFKLISLLLKVSPLVKTIKVFVSNLGLFFPVLSMAVKMMICSPNEAVLTTGRRLDRHFHFIIII